MIIKSILEHPYVIAGRHIAGELGRGLGLAWWFMLLLEFVRPGIVSLYFNLNLWLLVAIVLWLVGMPLPEARPYKYTAAVVSAILVAALGVSLAPWSWIALPLGAIAGLIWYVAQQQIKI